MIYDWDIHSAEIVRRLEQPAWLKICTKNLDEPELIEAWITHHGAIVGFENLIIADNYSSHHETIRVYSKYSDAVTIFRFSGNFDDVHAHPRFSHLFNAIRRSSKFYAIFDTDERLVIIEDGYWKAGLAILQRLSVADAEKPIPSTWLINKMNCLNRFNFKTTEGAEEFVHNLIWGKPILPAKLVGLQAGIHNIEFRSYTFSASRRLNLFLLHLTQLPDRRLRVNKSKLVNSGVIDEARAFDEIAAMDTSALSNSNAVRFITEIRDMLAVKRFGVRAETDEERSLELEPGGSIRYSSGAAREFMKRFLDCMESTIPAVFGSK